MKSLITLMFVFVSGYLYAGGGWPKPKGEGYFKLGQGLINGTNYYEPNGRCVASQPFH